MASDERRGELFEGLAEFEIDFFRNLVRSYAKLDLGMRGFFYHRIKQVVKEAIDLLRTEDAASEPITMTNKAKPD